MTARKVVSWKILCSHITNFLRHLCSGHFWSIFRTWRQRCNRRLWRKQMCFLPLTRFYSNVHVRARTITRSISQKHVHSICFLYFPWRIVSQKSTFNGKRFTRERSHTGNIRIGAGAKGHCFVRKLRIAQLRILTISGHVIAVSAQQRDNEKGVRCIRRRSGSAAGQFF